MFEFLPFLGYGKCFTRLMATMVEIITKYIGPKFSKDLISLPITDQWHDGLEGGEHIESQPYANCISARHRPNQTQRNRHRGRTRGQS